MTTSLLLPWAVMSCIIMFAQPSNLNILAETFRCCLQYEALQCQFAFLFAKTVLLSKQKLSFLVLQGISRFYQWHMEEIVEVDGFWDAGVCLAREWLSSRVQGKLAIPMTVLSIPFFFDQVENPPFHSLQLIEDPMLSYVVLWFQGFCIVSFTCRSLESIFSP